jgi:Outer membrane protein beta-barrel domain
LVNNLVLRLSFGVVSLLQSCVVCGLAHAQSSARALVPQNSESEFVAATPSLTSSQFPATDASLIANNSSANVSFSSSLAVDPGNLAAFSPLAAPSADATLSWPASAPAPQPAPEPTPNSYSYSENPNKWQLGVAFALVRFRSSVYFATAPGFNTSLAYSWKDWVAIEGSVTSAFAPPVFENEHFRYLGYGAGPKFSFGNGRLQPWAHALVGGVHLIPQTASSGRNGFEVTMGGGVDYGINNVISAKVGVDYLGTHIFDAWQSSAQIVAGFSFRF